MRIEESLKLDFSDVLIRPKRSNLKSRADVDLVRKYKPVHNQHISLSGIPIIASNMDHTGTFAVAKALAKHKMFTTVSKFATESEWLSEIEKNPALLNYAFVTAGASSADFEILKKIVKSTNSNLICLDVANGYTQFFVDKVKKVRQTFSEKIIMAGNVVSGEMTEELIISGADIVKVGIGPGSVCTTRKKAGVGYPQLSAIIECADAAHGLGGLVCADGGCVVPGDVAKAFAAGADFVMLGGMLAGHDECLGDIIEMNREKFKRFYGMSSREAMMKYVGKVADYKACEGKSVNVPYRGEIERTVHEILGGVRSTCTYVGASKLKELSKRTTFIKVTHQINEVYSQNELVD